MKQNPVTFFIGLLVIFLSLPSPVLAVSCSLSDNATNTLNSACVVDGTNFTEGGATSFNGITNGDMVVSGADVTVSPGVTMTWSPGKAIIIENGGRIIRGANAVLKQIDPQTWFRQMLGFDTYAAGSPVKVLGQNLQVCSADPCTVTAPAGGGSLVVENSIKFGDGTSQTTAASGMTSGMIVAFASTCPTGWTEYTAARGRTIVGTPDGATHIASTQGTALTDLENRAVGQHTHTGTTDSGGSHTHSISDPGHSHFMGYSAGPDSGLNWQQYHAGSNAIYTGASTTGISIVSGGAHTHTFTTAASGSVAGTNAPYIQLVYCSKN